MDDRADVGVIGGTGLYEIQGLEEVRKIDIGTPFGPTSSSLVLGRISGVEVGFIARHGESHSLLPSEVPYLANIWALKSLGARWCLSLSAVGSLKEELKPGEVVVPDQFIDRTKTRRSTFFGEGVVAHVPFGVPFCPTFRELLYEVASSVAEERGTLAHLGGTYVCMEGPAFSTRAESFMYRSWGGALIGMTNLPEAKLAREAEMAYATLALVTDYDCWHDECPDVDYEIILKTLSENADLAKEVIGRIVPILGASEPSSIARDALGTSLVSKPESISGLARERLWPILARYVRDL